MKLYATITSERASKGQGGNERLDIQITVGTPHFSAGVIAVREISPDVYTIVYFKNGIGKLVARIDGQMSLKELRELERKTPSNSPKYEGIVSAIENAEYQGAKGKRQKGKTAQQEAREQLREDREHDAFNAGMQ